MTLYLLDSDAVIDYLKGGQDSIALLRQILAQENVFCTCDVVLTEVHSGLDPTDNNARSWIETLLFLDTARAAAELAGRWRYEYARLGVSLSTHDTLIGAVALTHSATLVTGNARHYPMPELSLLPLPR